MVLLVVVCMDFVWVIVVLWMVLFCYFSKFVLYVSVNVSLGSSL